MMIGAPDVPIRAVDPADGTCTTVVKLSFQSVTARSCLRLVIVLGTSNVWVRLWLSVTARDAVCPALSQVMLLASTAVPSKRSGVRALSIGWEEAGLRLSRSATACWASGRGVSLKVEPVTLGAGSVRNATE